jgi:transposase
MRIVHDRCAGLDVHKKTVHAHVLWVDDDGELHAEARCFGTMTGNLLMLADWLAEHRVSHVAMESTGVYWKPIYHILEGHFDVMLVNAHHIKRVPGRKTDVKDAEWIAELLRHGLLSPSFIPPVEVRELRDLTRQRTILVRERATVANRVQKLLEDANIKLASVASDALGVSGRAMIRALIGGEEDPEKLADLARRRLRVKRPALRQAMLGRVTDHHRFLLRMLLDQVEYLERAIRQFEDRIEAALRPFADAVARLEVVPGIGHTTAATIVAEIGVDMGRFPTAGHLASWAGMCPGNDQSAGKRRSGKTTKGDQWLRSMLVQAAWAAAHAKDTVFQAQYRRWSKRMGRKKALVAVGHKLLRVIYHLLQTGTDYRETMAPPKAA